MGLPVLEAICSAWASTAANFWAWLPMAIAKVNSDLLIHLK